MAGRSRAAGVPRWMVQELAQLLQEGHTFTDAMQLASGQKRDATMAVKVRSGYWLSDFDVALLSAGEESGRLDSSMRTLARFYRARARIIRDTISGSMVTFLTLNVFLLVFPVGLLQEFAKGIMDSRFQECLPFIIEKAIAFGLLYGGFSLLAFVFQGHRGESFRAMIEAFLNVIPMLREAIKYIAVARLSLALEALFNAGVPVIRAWELAAAACGSVHLKREVGKWGPQLEAGITPAELVAQTPYFPETFAHLYQAGEISGKMDETLTRLHQYHEQEGFNKLQFFFRVFGYLLYFGMVALAGFFVIRFWMGYFSQAISAF
jgi:type II secretory pathway component PulF